MGLLGAYAVASEPVAYIASMNFGIIFLYLMKEAVIVSAVRTAVGKAPKGTLRNTRPDDLAAAAIKEAVDRVEGLDKGQVEDVIMGCAFPEAEQGMNVARTAMIAAGLPVETSR
jgi:acetyl-CoA acyltransferase